MTDRPVHALIVSIDEYPKLDPDRRLRGAIADANAMANLLRQKCANLHLNMLIDSEATHNAILGALDGLVNAVGSGDEVLFYWSGHGSQVLDQSSDEEEEDGWDETLVPYDSGRGEYPNKDVIDDEIFVRLQELGKTTSRITIILDSCHSGTAVRTGVRGVSRDSRLPKSLKNALQRREISRELDKPRGASGWLPISDQYVLLAACREDQEALELPFRGQVRGAFTWQLCKELENAAPNATWGEIFALVERSLASSTYGAQIPQIEGARRRELPW